MMTRKNYIALGALLLMLILIAADLMVGGRFIDILHPSDAQRLILLKLRLPRVLTATFAGASLSIAGLQMQSVFRNPLADPHILGVSSGASLAAAVVSMLVPSTLLGALPVVFASFMGAALVSLLIMSLSAKVRNSNILLIFGVLVGYIFSALVSIISVSASDKALKAFYIWTAGSFSSASLPQTAFFGAMSLAGFCLLMLNSSSLDLLLFGDEFAKSTGSNVRRARIIALLSCCLLTATATAFCGPLGFVGIISPHIARRLVGSAVHTRIALATLLIGADTALTADILSMVFPNPLPVGSMMAVLGVPVVIYIMFKEWK